MQSDLLQCLIQHSFSLVTITKDLVLKGFWPLLVNLVNMAGFKLKMTSLNFLTQLMKRKCSTKNSKILHNFASLTFQLLQDYDPKIVAEALEILHENGKNDEILKSICQQESFMLWNKMAEAKNWFLFEKFSGILSLFFAQIVDKVELSQEILDNFQCGEEIFAQIVIIELKKSENWLKEQDKIQKLNSGVKT